MKKKAEAAATPDTPGNPGTPGTPGIPGYVTQVWTCEGIKSRGQAVIFVIPVSFGQDPIQWIPNPKLSPVIWKYVGPLGPLVMTPGS